MLCPLSLPVSPRSLRFAPSSLAVLAVCLLVTFDENPAIGVCARANFRRNACVEMLLPIAWKSVWKAEKCPWTEAAPGIDSLDIAYRARRIPSRSRDALPVPYCDYVFQFVRTLCSLYADMYTNSW